MSETESFFVTEWNTVLMVRACTFSCSQAWHTLGIVSQLTFVTDYLPKDLECVSAVT